MAIRVFIPESFIALHQEIPHHPLLLQRIQKHPEGETLLVLAETAAYCGIAVDGEFVEEELAQLAHFCWERLTKLRAKPEIYIPPEDWSAQYEALVREMYNKRKIH